MPLRRLQPQQDQPESQPAPPHGRFRRIAPSTGTTVASTMPSAEDDLDLGKMLLGGGGAALVAMLLRKPGGLQKAFSTANTIRQQLMLSGFAPLKSLLGNVGGTAIQAAETKSMEPLRQLFSRQTGRDIAEAYKNPSFHPSYGTDLPKWLPTPGRAMGALDMATQKALVRAGSTPEEAARTMFQAPVTGRLGDVLESEAGRYLVPFRRTPVNQFLEGFDILKTRQHPAILAGTAGAGAVHGAATADERYPFSIGLGTAAAAKYGVPYALGALAGRTLASGRQGAGIAGTILPVSEYGIQQAIADPLQPLREPAALRALRRLRGQ